MPSGIRPDGTVKDSLRMARGYWEAKDSGDDLDVEIQKKFSSGYPKDNIIFEDTVTAVLFQNGGESMRVDMKQSERLHALICHFLDHQPVQIEEFRRAQDQFKTDLPAVLKNLRGTLEEAERHNSRYRQRAAAFLDLCHRTISSSVTEADVREMVLQHILTEDIFLRVFAEDQFHRENNIARQLKFLENTFFTGNVRRQAIDRLRTYYGAIGRAADDIADYAEKQWFLKRIYEDFYKVYNPEAADRLGVVYTPNEVVDFIIRGVDHLLQKHFKRSLADRNTQILDPATGTGTFITNLINYLDRVLPSEWLEYKYLNEIHANEVAILAYYIANLNVEYTYKEHTGRYLEFPNLCFVDTLDNVGWQSQRAGEALKSDASTALGQASFNLGGLSEENWIRVQEQNEKTISIIIGNPPYNDSAVIWGDGTANRTYRAVDRRISDTYIAESTAQKTHQYDMYKRFIRWASDRLSDDGIIGFITNRAYLDSRQDDGFRKVVSEEFTDVYILDLGSDVRRNPKISGTTHNVFGIQTGVAIAFFVRDSSKLGNCQIHYARREDDELAWDKLSYLRETELFDIPFLEIRSDHRNNWFNKSDSDFYSHIPVADRASKYSKIASNRRSIFGLYANAVKTNRDDWVYDFDVTSLRNKVHFFADTYNDALASNDLSYDPVIKWSRDLRNEFLRSRTIIYSEADRIQSLYRPFVVKHHFANFTLNDVLTRNHYEMFGRELNKENRVICFSGRASNKDFQVLATDKLPGFDTLEKTQCLPLYRYTEGGNCVSNITEWGLKQFRRQYNDDAISAEEVFAYTYAILHDPDYRDKYEIDLRQEFPHIPFYPDFKSWARVGQSLLDLHLGFETVEPYSLRLLDKGGGVKQVILSVSKDRGMIILDDQTSLRGVPLVAWKYRLGIRSALEWILDQYAQRKPRHTTIEERFNTYRFADYKEQVIDLLRRVCTVSVRTMELIDSMPARSCPERADV